MKKKILTTKKENKGITLIALVITVIVLLILAAVSIATLTGENGLLAKATTAKKQTEIADIIERAKIDILGAQEEKKSGDITEAEVDSILEPKYGTLSGEGEDKVLTTDKGYVIKVSDIWSGTTVSISNGVSIGEIFDESGEIDGKLHIGDFINYTAGNWTDEDMSKIAESGAKVAANNSTDKPSTAYQFGGFTNTSSRDGNATPYSTTYNYVKDKSTGNAVTGWRLFDVADDGTITLISAGCPEEYYHPSGTNCAYISGYILTGNKR